MKFDWERSNKLKQIANGCSLTIHGRPGSETHYPALSFWMIRKVGQQRSPSDNIPVIFDSSSLSSLPCFQYKLSSIVITTNQQSSFDPTRKKPSKSDLKRSMVGWTSWVPAVSRIECIESIGAPTSTVRIPICERSGPTVEPQGLNKDGCINAIPNGNVEDQTYMSFLTSNSWTSPP